MSQSYTHFGYNNTYFGYIKNIPLACVWSTWQSKRFRLAVLNMDTAREKMHAVPAHNDAIATKLAAQFATAC
jgi:hypothetical protein